MSNINIFWQRQTSRSSTINSQLSITEGINTANITDLKEIQKDEDNDTLRQLSIRLSSNRTNQIMNAMIFKPNDTVQRRKIMECYDMKKSIIMAYDLLKANRDYLIESIENKTIIIKPNDNDYKATHNTFKHYLEICCNYLLLIMLHLKNEEKKHAAIALHHLLKDTKNIFHIDSFINSIVRMPQKTDESLSIIDYLNYLSSLIKCSLKIKRNYIYEMCLLKYIAFIESLNEYQKFQPYLYFYLGRVFIESDYLKIAEICYSKAIITHKAIRFQITSMYNQGLLYYITNKTKDALKLFNKSLDLLKNNTNREKEDTDVNIARKTVEVYLILGEIVIEDKKKSFDYLDKIFDYDISNSSILTPNNRIILDYLLNLVYELQYIPSEENVKKEAKPQNNNEEFIEYCISQIKKPIVKDLDVQEFEKFFLFMTKLSIYQVELLNKEQPEIHDFKKKCSLPIYFSNGFKQSLSLEQRVELNKIKFLSLKRKSILKRPDQKIALENFELKTLYRVNNSTSIDLAEMKNISAIKSKVKEFSFAKRHKKINQITPEKMQSNHNTINTRSSLERSKKLPEFKHAKAFSFISFVKEIDDLIIKKNINFKRQEESLLSDEKLILLLNKMSLEDVMMLKENPLCLIELLQEQKDNAKVKQKTKEEAMKLLRHNSILIRNDNDDELNEDGGNAKNDNDEDNLNEDLDYKKNNDEANPVLDAMNIGKDD